MGSLKNDRNGLKNWALENGPKDWVFSKYIYIYLYHLIEYIKYKNKILLKFLII